MMNQFGQKIRTIRKNAGLSQLEFARIIGSDQSSVSKWESGSRSSMKIATAAAVAREGGITIEQLQENTELELEVDIASIPVLGDIAAGKFVESFDGDAEYEIINVPYHPAYRKSSRRVAYRIAGESMNELYPHGSYIICLNLIEIGYQPRHGERVVVHRRDRFGLNEYTVKELEIASDGTKWLVPKSTDRAHQQPFKAVEAGHQDGGDTAVMIGLVIDCLLPPELVHLRPGEAPAILRQVDTNY